MLRNYLKVAMRYLVRHKGYTIINILGLAVGITCCILIMLFVKSEWSYDKFHSKSDRLYRAWVKEKYQKEDFIDITTPVVMAPTLQSNFPEIESTCRVAAFNSIFKSGVTSFNENLRMVDSTFFRVFDFELIKGDRKNPFPTSNSIILTEKLAKKYFGNSDPVGKSIELQMSLDTVVFSVSGIAKEAPVESSIRYTALIPFSNAKSYFSKNAMRSWFNINPETYVLLGKGVNPKQLEAKFPSMLKQQLGADYKPGNYIINLQPMTTIHLDASLPDQGIENISNPKYSYILLTIGFLILFIACINFITLSLGRSTSRAMEVGVRKVLGAERRQIIRQFWGEAILLTLVSVVIGIIFAAVFVKPFNTLINRELVLRPDLFFIGFCLLLIVIIGMIAGIYPALILSSFKPVEVLKGKLKLSNNSSIFRKSLITGQFVVSIAMIVCTLVIGQQMNYLQNKDLGYGKEQVVVVSTHKPVSKGMPLAELFRNELQKIPQVASASVALYSMAQTPWIDLGYTDDKKIYRTFQFNAVDPQFIPTMKIQMVQGRNFSADNASDATTAMVVNESLVKQYGWKDAIGKKLPGKFEQQIIGVMKDFNYESLHTKIQPLVLVIKPDSVYRRIENINVAAPRQPRISVRMKAGSITANIAMLKQAWKKVAGEQEFDYTFLDENIAAQYEQEKRTSTIVKLASGLSIFIACMGLFGLATLAVVRRTKEIGIRKVLGASTQSIVSLISKEFITLVVLAAIIAFPLAWMFLNKWLGDFAYRIDINWWVFILAAFIAIVITLLTVGFQAIKAALSNPVKSLRTE
ncbi:MAG: hypothetical protein JWN76_680 [Chitinophagaceae bacterium]|nr:hypothetical protein [Chitinophagaceae bacterium]